MEEKTKLVKSLANLLDERIASAFSAMESARESKNQETKSSAGDKFETGRAMMQREEEKNTIQWTQLKELKLKLLNLQTPPGSKIAQGSLIYTDSGKYFISIGIGKFTLENQKYFVISSDSPIGQLFIGKEKDDSILFNGSQINILDIK